MPPAAAGKEPAESSAPSPAKKPKADGAAPAGPSSSRPGSAIKPLTQYAPAQKKKCDTFAHATPFAYVHACGFSFREEKDRLNAKYGKIKQPTPSELADVAKGCKMQ